MNIVHPHTNLVEELLALVRHFPVIPLHNPLNGGCSCRKKTQCSDPGKHPRTRHGLKDATRDEAKIRELVHEHPNMNVAIPTGYQYGILGLDFDGKLGLDSRYKLEQKYGPLPETVSTKTGRGEHSLYRISTSIKSRNGIFPGIDVKADGGMLVAPPSRHANGRVYTWINSPDEMPIAEAPPWLIDLLCDPKPTVDQSTEAVPKGKRNDTLFKFACSLRSKGFSEEEIIIRLREVSCNPPLPDSEIRKIAASACRYPAGKVIALPIEPVTPKMVFSWAKMPLRALYDKRLSKGSYLLVLGILSSRVIKTLGYATIHQQTVVDLINANRPEKSISLRTVNRTISKLAKFGYIEILHRKQKSPNSYLNQTFYKVICEPEKATVYDNQDDVGLRQPG